MELGRRRFAKAAAGIMAPRIAVSRTGRLLGSSTAAVTVLQRYGTGLALFIEIRHPGQTLDTDRFEITQDPATTRRSSLPALLDADRELEGMRLVENTPARFAGNPVLRRTDVPDPAGLGQGAAHGDVLRDGSRFQRYFCGRNAAARWRGMNSFSVDHALSEDGVRWTLTSDPVLSPGVAGAWDEASLGMRVVKRPRSTAAVSAP